MAPLKTGKLARGGRRPLPTAIPVTARRAQLPLLKLYIADRRGRSLTALANLKRLRTESLAGRCRLRVIDLLQHPTVAYRDNIIAIPTLVCQLAPGNVRRLLGDLSNARQLLRALDLEAP